ncbi:hypothetical protein CSW98_00320 [Vibrio sp. HA2012]|uniref:DUF6129 family protein n=1 Tax=Vibrio sp. HA2012 TaxID=1971595 RepID=UPI000C2C9B94|nr:DUF6129 family protein [Vibrio sp. HA2012]PJC87608.1 hypothetical protein CSW98_00320 [Vibrio sp. HA2012]
MTTMDVVIVGEADIQQIGTVLEGLEYVDDDMISRMRLAYPHIRFTLCSEDDTGEREPYASYCGFDIHLVSSGAGACSLLTHNIEQCTGLVIALHEE